MKDKKIIMKNDRILKQFFNWMNISIPSSVVLPGLKFIMFVTDAFELGFLAKSWYQLNVKD